MSLLFSLCLRPQIAVSRLSSLTPTAAEAVCEVISALGLDASVKPPNDVLVSGKKVAGILAEAVEGRVALGIGLNVSQRAGDLPERPVFPATSLEIELGQEPDRVELLTAILKRLESRYERWLEEER
jgi:BirA family biotin operon repressor/biotin-[acetyl-CoA-carboxylase] ligase